MKTIKKLSSVVLGLFAVSACAVGLNLQTASADEDPMNLVDVTDNVSVTNWVDHAEWQVTYLSLGEGVIPDIGYGVIDQASYKYVQEYIVINGNTIQEINADDSLGAKDWTYTVHPSTMSDFYKIPIIVFENNDMLEIKIHDSYLETLGDKVEVTAKAGLYFEHNMTRYEVNADKTFTVWESGEVDVTANISATGWDKTGDAKELMYTRLSLGAGVLPSTLGYGIIDKSAYKYLQEYIAINGKTVKEINEGTDVSGYNFATFPSTNGGVYAVPVIIYMNKDKLEIKVHSNYVATLGDKVELTVKAGFCIENNGVQYVVPADKTLTVWEKVIIPEVDITANISAEGWDKTGDAGELVYTRLSLGAGVLPSWLGYGIIDNSAFKYLQEYIAINGKTVKEINEGTDVSGYNFATFPSTANAKYKLPVLILLNGDLLEIKVHNNYAATLGDQVDLTVKAGFSVENDGKLYLVSEDKTLTIWEKAILPESDIASNVSLSGWETTGDAGELTYVRIKLGEGVLPEEVYYGIMDRDEWKYLQNYVYFNGKSIKEINETTDVSSYVFSTFPSTENDIYKLPIIIYANNDALEIKFHNDYLQTAGDKLEITLKDGFCVVNNGVQYVLNKDMTFLRASNIWADVDRTYTITYYVNGVIYGEVEELPFNTAFTVRDDVVAEKGYAFSGWEYTATETVVQDMEIHGYIRPVCYTITYHLNGGKNDAGNPITYYVTDGEVTLKDATKEGAVFKGWYTSEDYSEKIDTLSADTLGDLQLYALFEEASKKGCGSVTGMGSALMTLAGVALLTKKRKNDE